MNTKNRLIEKLLKVAKKHKVLTYPVLALVAVLSVIGYFFSWSKGAGKRVVAVVMVMVMLVSQSYFLTSSATALVDDEDAALVQKELQEGMFEDETKDQNSTRATTEAATSVTTEAAAGTEVSTETVADNPGTMPATEENGKGDSSSAEAVNTDNTQEVLDEDTDSKLANEKKAVTFEFYYTAGNGSRSLIAVNSKPSTIQSNEEGDESTSYTYDLSTWPSAALTAANDSYSEGGCYEFDGWYYDVACMQPVENLSSVYANELNGGMIALYCKRTLIKYKVAIVKNNNGEDDPVGFSTNADSNDANYYYVAAQGSDNTKTGSLTVSDITRKGYAVSGAEVAGGGSAALGEDSNSVVVTFSGTECMKTVTLQWTGSKYKIQYAAEDKADSAIGRVQEVTYGSASDYFLAGAGIAADKEGYKFAGWTIGLGGTAVTPGTLVSTMQSALYPSTYPQAEHDITTLYPYYTYDEVEITRNSINYEYKKPAETILIQGRYKEGNKAGSTNFTYAIKSGDSELEATYGIKVSASANGISFVTSGPIKTTAASGIDLIFDITDSMAPAGQQTTTHTVKVYIAPRIVVLREPSDNSNKKTYDGTTKSYLATDTPLKTNIDEVTVSFTSSQYNSKDVAEADRIILANAVLNVPAGEETENYVLSKEGESYSIPGSIAPRSVYLKTFAILVGEKQYIRAGEMNPEFGVEEDTSENSLQVGFLEGDSIDDLGEITFSTNRPEDLTAEGTYTISADAASTSNYKVKIDSEDKGTFRVVMEAPEEGNNFIISGTKGNGDWYITNPAQVRPAGGDYDIVRVSKDGSVENASGSVLDLSEAEYPKDTDIYVQLYHSGTGAVTSWKKISVSVDETAPEYISYVLTQGGDTLYDSNPIDGGLYFPTKGMVTFGNYFNRTVNVTVKYRDVSSGLSTLQYGLYGEEAGTRTALFGETDENGYATATFEILKEAVEKAGIVTYYAEDIAGNKGNNHTLQRDGTSEWSVETSGPVIEGFLVKAGEKQLETVVSGSMDYYSNCKAVLYVKDATSGIYSVAWDVNGERFDEERVTNTSAKQTEWTFHKDINRTNFPNESGDYSIYAVITDNAGNIAATDTIHFKVDDEPPVIEITSEYDIWQPNVKLEFNTYDDLSGIKYINVTDENGELIEHHVENVENGTSYCYFETTIKGVYNIIVSDKAGNINQYKITLNKVSNEVPSCPGITFLPEDAVGNDGWYTTVPSVIIGNVTETEDGTPVTTRYQLWEEGETAYNETTIPADNASISVDIPGEGIYNLKIWSESITGLQCADVHEYQLKVDTLPPEIKFTTSKGSGATILVNFTITDTGSGVDSETIKIQHGTKDITAKVEASDEGYTGSFEISETGNYSIHAADIAGNVSDAAAFTPMSMKIKAVTNISDSNATLGANIIKGTFDVTAASLEYRKYTEETYTQIEAVSNTDENGNVALSAVLNNLEPGTAYVFKVTAISAADEVLEYEGYFKTLSFDEQGISVSGTVKYANDIEGVITVGLFEGNVCIMAKEVNAGEEFIFHNIPDGNYSIVATDGTYSKTMRLTVQDGLVVYPENYIELILSGKNTSVVITTDETPNITVDNMDSIFNDDMVNFTEDDKLLIEAGGTVEFKLYATLMRVSNVSANEISAMYAVTDKNKIAGAYLDLSLYKIVTGPNGETERTRVTNLASGASLSVTIPLGDLAGKSGLEVIRIHDDGENFIGASLADMDNNPGTYTVVTNQFSTYAVLYSREEVPTAEPSTEPISNGTTNPSIDSTIENPSDDIDNDTDKKKKDKDKTPSNSSVGSLKSSGSAKTGDGTPIAVMGSILLLSVGGFLFLRRKIK